MILSGSKCEQFSKLQDENIPVVFFDREFENLPVAKVITNDYECGYLAAAHLIKNGCKNPVFLSTSSCLGICKKRANGFLAALKDKKTGHPEIAIVECKGPKEEDSSQIKKLLKSKDRPDGIVTSVERQAISAYLACHELDVSIPAALKIVAFSTLKTAPILNPPLTTIVQPAFDMGKAATESLFKEIEKKRIDIAHQIVILPSSLIERKSSQIL